MRITSLANPTVKILRGLHTRKVRRESGLFLAEGARIIRDALDCGWQPRHLAFLDGRENDESLGPVIAKAREAGAEILAMSEAVLGKISRKDNPQMVLASFTERWQEPGAESGALTGCRIGLDRVRDPGNLGTILRSADAVGADGIILIGECCDGFSPEAVRASMGAVFTVPMMRMEEAAFIDYAKNIHTIGTALPADTDYRDANWQEPMILLMGNEQGGLSDGLQNACDELVQLPMHGKSDSLNLGVATGICLYEYLRQMPLRQKP